MTLSTEHHSLLESAHLALRQYSLPPASELKLVNLSENATFKVAVEDGLFFALRLHRPGYHSRAAIQSELDWLMALRNDSVAITPIPIFLNCVFQFRCSRCRTAQQCRVFESHP